MLADGTFASVAAASAHLRQLGRERSEAARLGWAATLYALSI